MTSQNAKRIPTLNAAYRLETLVEGKKKMMFNLTPMGIATIVGLAIPERWPFFGCPI